MLIAIEPTGGDAKYCCIECSASGPPSTSAKGSSSTRHSLWARWWMARTSCNKCSLAFYNGKDIVSDCRQAKLGGGCNDARLIFELKALLADRIAGRVLPTAPVYGGGRALAANATLELLDKTTRCVVDAHACGVTIGYGFSDGFRERSHLFRQFFFGWDF